LYLAPEVFGGDAATIQSDIYSLGVLLHHLVTGSYPVTARTLGALAAAHKGKVRTPLRTARPDLPPPFVDIVDRATAPAAHLRWANAQELESALAGTLARPQTNGPSEMVDRSGVGRRRRRQERNAYRALVTAVVIAVVILIAGGVWVFRERSVVPVGPRALVLVADFDNTTDVPNLGQSVKAWLEQELANSRVVDNVPTVRINDQLKLMVRDPEERITPALAREICERDGGIHRYITGAAAPVGARYILTASLFAPDGREVGNAREVAASQEELIPSIQRLAGRIRELAGESRAEITQADQDALRVTTPSLEAYRLYRLAYTRRDKQDWEKSQALIDQALQYDREFPSAHIWRAWALWHAYKDRGLNTKDEAEAEATRARDLRDNASPWERLWIEGSYGSITGKLELAAAAYKALLDLYPTHDWAVGNLENVTGRLNRPFEALPYATSAADLRPYDRLAVEEAAFATLEAGDTSRARQYMERLRGIRANSANAINAAEVGIVEAWAAWKRGEAKEARGLLDPIVPALSLSGWTIRGGAGVRGSVVRLYLALGRPTDAKRVATSPFSASLVSYWQEDDEMLRSSLPAKLSFDKPAEDQMAPEEWTIMLLQAGNLGEAERRVDFAFRQAPPSGGSSFLAVLKARLLRSHNDDAGALKLLLTTSATAEPSPLYVADRADILADLRIEQGKNQDALETLRAAKWNSATSDCYTPLLGMKNLARLAGLERQFGKVTEADQIDAELRRLLTEAEPDFPLARRLGEKAAHK
jgi:Tfp pilus assembly protein PilF